MPVGRVLGPSSQGPTRYLIRDCMDVKGLTDGSEGRTDTSTSVALHLAPGTSSRCSR